MSSATLPSYNLAPPTEEDARVSLARICCNGAGSKWDRLRAGARPAGDQPLTLEQLQALAESCVAREGRERVFGVSLLVRIQTYLTLRDRLRGLNSA